MGLKLPLQSLHGVTQHQSALFETTQGEFVGRRIGRTPVDDRIEIGMFHAQFDQLTVGGVQTGFQGKGPRAWQKCHRRADNTRLARFPRQAFA